MFFFHKVVHISCSGPNVSCLSSCQLQGLCELECTVVDFILFERLFQ
jgi:hypothetical protein